MKSDTFESDNRKVTIGHNWSIGQEDVCFRSPSWVVHGHPGRTTRTNVSSGRWTYLGGPSIHPLGINFDIKLQSYKTVYFQVHSKLIKVFFVSFYYKLHDLKLPMFRYR